MPAIRPTITSMICRCVMIGDPGVWRDARTVRVGAVAVEDIIFLRKIAYLHICTRARMQRANLCSHAKLSGNDGAVTRTGEGQADAGSPPRRPGERGLSPRNRRAVRRGIGP